MAESQIGHRKSSLVLSTRFPVVKWRSRSVAKSAYYLQLSLFPKPRSPTRTLCHLGAKSSTDIFAFILGDNPLSSGCLRLPRWRGTDGRGNSPEEEWEVLCGVRVRDRATTDDGLEVTGRLVREAPYALKVREYNVYCSLIPLNRL